MENGGEEDEQQKLIMSRDSLSRASLNLSFSTFNHHDPPRARMSMHDNGSESQNGRPSLSLKDVGEQTAAASTSTATAEFLDALFPTSPDSHTPTLTQTSASTAASPSAYDHGPSPPDMSPTAPSPPLSYSLPPSPPLQLPPLVRTDSGAGSHANTVNSHESNAQSGHLESALDIHPHHFQPPHEPPTSTGEEASTHPDLDPDPHPHAATNPLSASNLGFHSSSTFPFLSAAASLTGTTATAARSWMGRMQDRACQWEREWGWMKQERDSGQAPKEKLKHDGVDGDEEERDIGRDGERRARPLATPSFPLATQLRECEEGETERVGCARELPPSPTLSFPTSNISDAQRADKEGIETSEQYADRVVKRESPTNVDVELSHSDDKKQQQQQQQQQRPVIRNSYDHYALHLRALLHAYTPLGDAKERQHPHHDATSASRIGILPLILRLVGALNTEHGRWMGIPDSHSQRLHLLRRMHRRYKREQRHKKQMMMNQMMQRLFGGYATWWQNETVNDVEEDANDDDDGHTNNNAESEDENDDSINEPWRWGRHAPESVHAQMQPVRDVLEIRAASVNHDNDDDAMSTPPFMLRDGDGSILRLRQQRQQQPCFPLRPTHPPLPDSIHLTFQNGFLVSHDFLSTNRRAGRMRLERVEKDAQFAAVTSGVVFGAKELIGRAVADAEECINQFNFVVVEGSLPVDVAPHRLFMPHSVFDHQWTSQTGLSDAPDTMRQWLASLLVKKRFPYMQLSTSGSVINLVGRESCVAICKLNGSGTGAGATRETDTDTEERTMAMASDKRMTTNHDMDQRVRLDALHMRWVMK